MHNFYCCYYNNALKYNILTILQVQEAAVINNSILNRFSSLIM